MKKLSILFASVLTFLALALPGLAAEPRPMADAKTAMENAIGYVGMAMRVQTDASGIRSMWSVNHETVTALEDEGYTVTYGAIMGIAKTDSSTVREDGKLMTVVPDAALGYKTEDQNAHAVVVYGTDLPSYASNKYTLINGNIRQFTYTTVFGEGYETAAFYNYEMAYRAFYVLEKDSQTEIGYVDVVPNQLPETVSLSTLANHFKTDTQYADNRLLLRILSINPAVTPVISATETDTGSGIVALADDGYKLYPGASFDLKITPAATGIYCLTTRVNNENLVVNYIDFQNKTEGLSEISGYYTVSRAGNWRYNAGTNLGPADEVTDYTTNDASTAPLGYIWLEGGKENTVTVTVRSGTGTSYNPVGFAKEFTATLSGLPVTEDNGNTVVIDMGSAYNTTRNLMDGYEKTFTPTVSGLYTVDALIRYFANTQLRIEFTANDVTQTLWALNTPDAVETADSPNACSTSYKLHAFDGNGTEGKLIYLEAGTQYTMTFTGTKSNSTAANFRTTGALLQLYKAVDGYEAVAPGAKTAEAVITPSASGDFAIVVSATGTAPLSLYIDGQKVASAEATAFIGLSNRTLGSFYFEKGRSYRLSVQNDGEAAALIQAPTASHAAGGNDKKDFTADMGSMLYSRDYSVTLTDSGVYSLSFGYAATTDCELSFTVLNAESTEIASNTVTLTAASTAVNGGRLTLDSGTYTIRVSGGDAVLALSAVELLPETGERHYSLLQGSTDINGFVNADGTAFVPGTANTNKTTGVYFAYYGGTTPPTNVGDFVLAENAGAPLKAQDNYNSGSPLTTPIGIKLTVGADSNYAVKLRLHNMASTSGNKGEFAYALMQGNTLPEESDYSTSGTFNGKGANKLFEITLTTKDLTAGDYTLYLRSLGQYTVWLWEIFLDDTAGTPEPIAATHVEDADTATLDLPVTVGTTGYYRLTMYVNAETSTDITATLLENSTVIGDPVTVSDISGDTVLYIPDNFPLFFTADYTLRLSLGSAAFEKASLSLASTLERTDIWFDASFKDVNDIITASSSSADHKGFSRRTTDSFTNYLDYGLPQANAGTLRAGNTSAAPHFDPMGVSLTVPESGRYLIRLLYTTGGTTKLPALSAWLDGSLTPSTTTEEATAGKGGSITDGTQLADDVTLASASGDVKTLLAYDIPVGSYTKGSHTLWLQNSGDWTAYFVGVQLIPMSEDFVLSEFSADIIDASLYLGTLTATYNTSGFLRYDTLNYFATISAYDAEDILLDTATQEVSCTAYTPAVSLSGITDYSYLTISFTDKKGNPIGEPLTYQKPAGDGYKVVYMPDTHMYDWELMFFESSAQRVAYAVDQIVKEHKERGEIDLLVLPGDVVNNWTGKRANGTQGSAAYDAGTFGYCGWTSGIVDGGWSTYTLNGKTYTSQYDGVTYDAGHSGTINDPKGVLRILSFMELMKPIQDLGIPILVVAGNHDCYNEKIWEMAFQMNQQEGYLGGAKQYEQDEYGNLIVPTYTIQNNKITLDLEHKVLTTDPDYEKYLKGYGTDYAYAFDDTTAYAIFDGYHNLSGDDEDGYGTSSSGKNWLKQPIAEETVNTLHALVKDYEEIYLVTHNANSNTIDEDHPVNCVQALIDYVNRVNAETPGKIVAVMDGDAHTEDAKMFADTTIWQFTCGYLGVPMQSMQPQFQDFPFSYRVVEKEGDSFITYITLFERDYPAFSFREDASISPFYQPYTRRKLQEFRNAESMAVAKYTAYEKDYFAGESALFLGDSITAAAIENNMIYKGWAGRIAIATGMSCANKAVSGWSISTCRNNGRQIVNQYTALSDTQKAAYSYIILHGGVNDAWDNAPVGAVTGDDVLTGFATDTFAGGLEDLFATVTAGSPDAKIGYIFNFYAPSHKSGTVKDMSLYFEAAKAVCDKWNIPFLNMYEDEQLTTEMAPTTQVNLYDYIHPSTAGYDILYRYIMYWMRDLPLYSEIKDDSSYTVAELQSMPVDLWTKNNPTE